MADQSNVVALASRLKLPLSKRLVAAFEAAVARGLTVDAALHTVVTERLAEIRADLKP